MKTQNKNLAFNKSSLVELNDEQLQDVNGGTGLLFSVGVVVGLTISIAMLGNEALGDDVIGPL